VSKLSWDQVLAFRLDRHFLTPPPGKENLLSVARALCGLHAQVASSPEIALWARIPGFRRGAVAKALEEQRTLVRTWTIRDTVHLIPADDLALYVGVLRPRAEGPSDGWLHQRGVTRKQYDAIIENVPRALDGRPRTRESLADRLVELAGPDVREPALESWGGVLKVSAHLGDLCFGPSRARNVTFVRPDRWLRRPLPKLEPEQARREFVRRAVGAFGVVSYDDIYRWVENSRIAKELVAASRDELVEVDVEGRHAWTLERDAEALSAQRRPQGLHLLPAFDPYLMAPRPREAFVATDDLRRVFRPQGRVAPVLLVDGRAAGVWSHDVRKERVRVEVELFRKLGIGARKALGEKVEELAAFLGGAAELSLVE
jgi:hypothetical protein